MKTMSTTQVQIGKMYRILPGYSMETRSRSKFDEITGLNVKVTRTLSQGDVEGEVYADDGHYIGDYFVNEHRLQLY